MATTTNLFAGDRPSPARIAVQLPVKRHLRIRRRPPEIHLDPFGNLIRRRKIFQFSRDIDVIE
ncbi:hypothetical protein ACN4EK_31760 [Pantanalinema rosaneae CENA516]|uniref:hypothetical protein n=1 Tax=Pantanalinema rosaneae TaxID=1620701 RepID=UPI003D6F379A